MINLSDIITRVWPTPKPTEKIPRGERLLLAGLAVIGLGAMVYFSGVFGPNFYWGNTGIFRHLNLYCPACGGTRAFEHLLHGRFLLAWQHNQLFVLSIPLIIYGGFILARSVISGYPLTGKYFTPALLWSLFGITMMFWVLRNIPLTSLDFLRPPL